MTSPASLTARPAVAPSEATWQDGPPGPPGVASAVAAPRSRRQDDWLVALLAFAWLAATAWARPLMLPDEGRYVGIAWEMMRSGDWLTPTLNGLPYFHKPPLFYWITAAAMSGFGTNEWAARMAPLAGAWIATLATWLLVRRWADLRLARLTLTVLLVQPLFYAGAQFANLDMLVAGCISATIALLAHAALCAQRNLPYRRALAAAYFAAALAVLAKGLIGVVLPALVVGVWLVARRRWRVLGALLWWPGMVLFLAVAAPWFVAMEWLHPGFFNYFFVVQHFHRFASSGFNNVEPFWFYGVLLLGFSLPWLPWLARLRINRSHLGDPQRSGLRSLMLLWLVLVTLFFSIPGSKLVGYVLPVLPALAFLSAEGFALQASPSAASRRRWKAGCAVAAMLGLAAVLWLTFAPTRSSKVIAAALHAGHVATEPVVMLHEYPFDLPFYAGLLAPVAIVDDWRESEVDKHDNWRKELADAGRFAKSVSARVLVDEAALAPLLCSAPTAWLIGHRRMLTRYPFLAAHEPVAADRSAMLWHVDAREPAVARALNCTPQRLQPPSPDH